MRNLEDYRDKGKDFKKLEKKKQDVRNNRNSFN